MIQARCPKCGSPAEERIFHENGMRNPATRVLECVLCGPIPVEPRQARTLAERLEASREAIKMRHTQPKGD